MEILKELFAILLVLFWIFILYKEYTCTKHNTEEWQKHMLCKNNIHIFVKKQISIFKIKQCKYCNHIKD